MSNLLDLKGRFGGLVLIFLLIIASEGVVGVRGMSMLQERIEYLDSALIPLLRIFSRIESLQVQQNHQFEKAPVDSQRPDHVLVNARIIDDQHNRLAQEIQHGLEISEAILKQHSFIGTEAEWRAIRQHLQDLQLAQKKQSTLLHDSAQRDATGATRLPQETNRLLVDHAETLESIADRLLAQSGEILGDAVNATLRLGDKAIYTLLLVWILSCVVCVILAIFLALSILRPVHLAQETIRRIAEGQTEIDLATSPRDELGELLESVRTMAVALRERTRLENLLQETEKMSSLGRLAIGLAHEVNNPLANALVNLEVMEMEQKESGHAPDPRLDVLRRNIERAMSITLELLNFSRPDVPDMAGVDLHDTLDGVLVLLGLQLRHVTVHRRYAPDLPEVNGVVGKLQQVFLNLFRNAIEAMPLGGELLVTTLHGDEWVQVEIRDNGPGIPPALYTKVLEPFFTTRVERGGWDWV
ncbi:MAG: ATP-binding protein [Magnetococcus sp. YQC-3]